MSYIEQAAQEILSIGRKLEDGDITRLIKDGATSWLMDYQGSWEFLRDMRSQALRREGKLSIGQARAVANCWRAELLKAAKQNDARHGAEALPAFLQEEPQAAEEPQAPAKRKRNVHRKTYTEMQQSPWSSSSRGYSPIMEYIKAPRNEPLAVQMEEDIFGPLWQAWADERDQAFKAACEREKALSL